MRVVLDRALGFLVAFVIVPAAIAASVILAQALIDEHRRALYWAEAPVPYAR